MSFFHMVYLHPFFQLTHPNPLSPSITGFPQLGHFPKTSTPSGASTLKCFAMESSFFIALTPSIVKFFIRFKKSSFLTFPLSISERVFSSLPVYSKSKSSLTGNISTMVLPSSVQVKLFPFVVIYPTSLSFLIVSALVAGVPILNPLSIEAIISSLSSSASSLKLLPQVSITLSKVFSVCFLGGFLVTLFILLSTKSTISFSFTIGRIVSLLSIFSTTLHPSTS